MSDPSDLTTTTTIKKRRVHLILDLHQFMLEELMDNNPSEVYLHVSMCQDSIR